MILLISIKKIIASVIIVFLTLILFFIVFGKPRHTGEIVKNIETTTMTTIETTILTTKTTTTTTTIPKTTLTTTEQSTGIPVQSETNSDCEALSCPPGTMFVGSKTSKKYHNCDCTWAKKISQQNLACFKNIEEAENSGYIPCKVCKPQ